MLKLSTATMNALLGGFIFLVAQSIYVEQAQAHHKYGHKIFVLGELGTSFYPLCDTQKQVEDIINANIEGGYEARVAKFSQYNHQRNGNGDDVACAIPSPSQGVWKFWVLAKKSSFQSVEAPPLVRGGERMVTHHVLEIMDRNGSIFYLMSTWDVEAPELELEPEGIDI